MTRHELKEQLQHDRFTDAVSGAAVYASLHRKQLILGGIVAVVIAAVIGAGFWYASYQRSVRQQALASALAVVQTPVGPATADGKSFPTEEAKRQAAIKALSSVVSQYGGSHEGLIAEYTLGTIKAAANDNKGAEADLRAVANSGDEFAALAKVALAHVYAGENRMAEAQNVLRGLTEKGSDLVSRAQANILLAQLLQTANPQQAKQILQSFKNDKDPAVVRAVNQISGTLTQ